MRSSKSRSRSKGNRNRSVGNIVNRVFDSSGPEGKVRGTPQQIIDKYNQLARDAQLGNDRVAAENFQQHAEHYLRMLAEAQREMQDRQQAQQGQQGQQGQGGGQQGADQRQGDSQSGAEQNDEQGGGQQGEWRGGRNRDRERNQFSDAEQRNDSPRAPDVIEMGESSDGGLVETPEDKPKRARKPRSKPAPAEAQAVEPSTPDAAE